MRTVLCENCGHANPADANFCSACGTPLSEAGDAPTMTIATAEPAADIDDEVALPLQEISHGVGVLVVKRGPNAGSRYALDGDVTRAGRHPDSDIFLDDITVSRRHAEFLREGDDYSVKDVGSLNGTYVNRERIDQAQLASGDEVQIGKFKLVFIAAASHA